MARRSRAGALGWLWWTLPATGAVVFAVLVGAWPLPAGILGVLLLLLYLQQAWARRRARRATTVAQAAGAGIWFGVLFDPTADWLWNGVPLMAYLVLDGGVPVSIAAGEPGLTIVVRGLARLLVRRGPRSIPWTDVAGARERRRGHSTWYGRPSLVTLTKVTVDVVGTSAAGWLGPDAASDDPRGTADAVDEFDDDLLDAQDEELGGDGWRPGTAPLQFTTPARDGLVDTVRRHGTGRPAATD